MIYISMERKASIKYAFTYWLPNSMWTLFAEYNKNGLFNGDEQIMKLLEEVTVKRGLNQPLVKRVLMFNKMLKTMDLKLLWIFYSWDIITGTINFCMIVNLTA